MCNCGIVLSQSYISQSHNLTLSPNANYRKKGQSLYVYKYKDWLLFFVLPQAPAGPCGPSGYPRSHALRARRCGRAVALAALRAVGLLTACEVHEYCFIPRAASGYFGRSRGIVADTSGLNMGEPVERSLRQMPRTNHFHLFHLLRRRSHFPRRKSDNLSTSVNR